MEKNEINKINKAGTFFIMGMILGAFFFIAVYGIKILNPCNDSWIWAKGGDISQHYTGWCFYRKSAWNFPIGLADGMFGNHKVSVAYTDSIPVFAVIFKLFSPVLPKTFQYFGIWEFFCYIMTGGFSCLLLKKLNKNKIIITAIESMFFIASPVIVFRAFGHSALSGQWIIIAALSIFVYQGYNFKFKFTPVILWGLMGIICAAVHLYFIPMIFIIFVAYIITQIAKYKKILMSILSFLSTLVLAIIQMYVLGYFTGNTEASASGLGVFSMNMNAFLNPINTSKFLKTKPYKKPQGEGYAYIGLGMAVIILICIIVLIINLTEKDGRKNFCNFLKNYKWEFISGLFMTVVSLFLAISPKAMFGNEIIYEIKYHGIIKQILAAFRSSGRFSWVAYYALFVFVFFIIARFSDLDKHRFAALVTVAVCLTIQLADFSAYFSTKRNIGNLKSEPVKEMYDEITNDADRIFFIVPNDKNKIKRYEKPYTYFARIALKYNMTLSSFHFARSDFKTIGNESDSVAKKPLDKHTVYVYLDKTKIPKSNNKNNIKFYYDNDYVIARCE